jgi:hypothetical protein
LEDTSIIAREGFAWAPVRGKRRVRIWSASRLLPA